MFKGYRFQPVNSDVDAVGLITAGQLQILTLGRATTDEHRVEFIAGQQRFQAVYWRIELQVYTATLGNVANFLIQHLRRQTEGGNVGAHQATGLTPLFKNRDFISQRGQIAGNGQGRRTRANTGNSLAIFLGRNLWQQV